MGKEESSVFTCHKNVKYSFDYLMVINELSLTDSQVHHDAIYGTMERAASKLDSSSIVFHFMSSSDLHAYAVNLCISRRISDMISCLISTAKKYYPSRQRLTIPLQPGSKEKPTVLQSKKCLKEYSDGNTDKLTVVFKDLGTQVSYRTLFFWEYLGPLVIYPVFYYFPVYHFFGYRGERVIRPVQTYALYYCHPLYTPVSDLQMKVGFGFGVVCQVANFYCHLLLRNLRSPNGSGGYQIPHGFLFNVVTCKLHNRDLSVAGLHRFNIAAQTVAGYIFMVVASSIMTNWALAKHRRLKRVNFFSLLLK
ncbi:unnamed protein product [Ilex paraguariensis]|uniref:3-oxo-5-alpha-steroid 4-dehydrogenase C-terminal domain-containing protein n=1 Tax=Ilex paraguariensis TaxID=185542 RepID=A0ABC8QP72_9AQUA